jgi:hypothetical protein
VKIVRDRMDYAFAGGKVSLRKNNETLQEVPEAGSRVQFLLFKANLNTRCLRI